jgi:hypothetical protein
VLVLLPLSWWVWCPANVSRLPLLQQPLLLLLTGAGLAAAALVGMVPSYISRSVAGSYDNEGVAIFALVFVFYTFIKVGDGGRARGEGGVPRCEDQRGGVHHL